MLDATSAGTLDQTDVNEDAVRRAVAAFNDPSARDGYLDLYDRTCEVHGLPPGLPGTFDGLSQFYHGLWAAFPDVTIDIEALFSEADSTAVRFKASGIHANDFFGMKADGKHATFYVILHIMFANRRVVRRWGQMTMVEA